MLVARASGQPFDEFLAERVFAPLGMVDTGFHVPAAKLDRFGACFGFDAATGESGPGAVYDPADGQWASPPAFPSGGAGLVSTLADVHAFGEMMLAGGTRGGERLLSRSTVAAMTTNQLTAAQLAEAGTDPDGAQGWGFCVGVELGAPRSRPLARHLRVGRRPRQHLGQRPGGGAGRGDADQQDVDVAGAAAGLPRLLDVRLHGAGRLTVPWVGGDR